MIIDKLINSFILNPMIWLISHLFDILIIAGIFYGAYRAYPYLKKYKEKYHREHDKKELKEKQERETLCETCKGTGFKIVEEEEDE